MSFFQPAPKTSEELEACAPLKVSPTDVAEMDEAQWYAEAYRGETPQLTLRAVLMGSFLGFFVGTLPGAGEGGHQDRDQRPVHLCA